MGGDKQSPKKKLAGMKRRRGDIPNFFGVFFDFPRDLRLLISSYSCDSYCQMCHAYYPTRLKCCLLCLKDGKTVKYITNAGFERHKKTNYDFEFNDVLDCHVWAYITPIITDEHALSERRWWESNKLRHEITLSVRKKRRQSQRLQKIVKEGSDSWMVTYYPIGRE